MNLLPPELCKPIVSYLDLDDVDTLRHASSQFFRYLNPGLIAHCYVAHYGLPYALYELLPAKFQVRAFRPYGHIPLEYRAQVVQQLLNLMLKASDVPSVRATIVHILRLATIDQGCVYTTIASSQLGRLVLSIDWKKVTFAHVEQKIRQFPTLGITQTTTLWPDRFKAMQRWIVQPLDSSRALEAVRFNGSRTSCLAHYTAVVSDVIGRFPERNPHKILEPYTLAEYFTFCEEVADDSILSCIITAHPLTQDRILHCAVSSLENLKYAFSLGKPRFPSLTSLLLERKYVKQLIAICQKAVSSDEARFCIAKIYLPIQRNVAAGLYEQEGVASMTIDISLNHIVTNLDPSHPTQILTFFDILAETYKSLESVTDRDYLHINEETLDTFLRRAQFRFFDMTSAGKATRNYGKVYHYYTKVKYLDDGETASGNAIAECMTDT